MEKLTEARKKVMERVRNGGYPSNGIFLQDRGDLLKKKNCGSKKPKSPINTRDFEHGAQNCKRYFKNSNI